MNHKWVKDPGYNRYTYGPFTLSYSESNRNWLLYDNNLWQTVFKTEDPPLATAWAVVKQYVNSQVRHVTALLTIWEKLEKEL